METLLDSFLSKSIPNILLPFFAGLFIGIVTCPSCAFPLGSYVLGKGKGVRTGMEMGILFNSGRLFTFAVLGAISGLMGNLLQDFPILFQAARTLVLLLLLVFGLEILGILKNPFYSIGIQKKSSHSIPLIMWGLALGTACFFEFFWIFSAILLKAFESGSMFLGVFAGISFGIGTALPSIMVATGSGALVAIYKRRKILKSFAGVLLVSLAFLSLPQGYLVKYGMLGAGIISFFLGLFFAGLIIRTDIESNTGMFMSIFILGSISAMAVQNVKLMVLFPLTFSQYLMPNLILYMLYFFGAISIFLRNNIK